ncbi:MAG: hypothetical protein IJQ14_05910 [Bacteroidales bacterium]|nr:hypothetical protein [Bacteroidales bacterium]
MNTKKKYIAPALTAVSFKVEKGFATSGFSTLQLENDIELMQNYYNEQGQENWYDEGENLFGSW